MLKAVHLLFISYSNSNPDRFFDRFAPRTTAGGQEINIEDLFGGGSPFGDIFGQRNPNAPRKGSDLQTEITVSFMEAAVHGVERDIDLSFQTQDPRTGRVETQRRNVSVNVPPGVNDGMNLRVAGQGGVRAFRSEATSSKFSISGCNSATLIVLVSTWTSLVNRYANF